MYNPARHNKDKKARLRRQNPHAGKKHSAIVRGNGVGRVAPVDHVLVQSAHGRESTLFSCGNFEVRYELFLAGNSTGYGYNENGDRSVRVLSGTVFLTIEKKNGEKITERVAAGTHLHAPAGVKHAYSTSGTEDAELLVVETPGYAEGWVEVEPPVMAKGMAPIISPPTASIPMRRKNTKAYEQASKAASRRNKRKGAGPKVVSPQQALAATGAQAAVSGLNPQPMKFAEE